MSATLLNLYAPAPKTERGKPCIIGGGEIKKVKKIVYCVGKSVIIRDLEDPLKAWVYNEHKADTTVARIAPSGFYIASADVSGKILVWDCVGDDKVIKLDKSTIGTILDMAWSDDSKRLVVGGQGREKQGEAFFTDGGASVGEITGHSATITSIDVKQTRPYRVATGSEDFKSNWFEGPPFKYKKTNLDHNRYVNCVRFSPDGNKYITVGSDKKGFLYDGKTGDKLGELSAEGAHGGSIYGVSWTSDGKIITASVDKTCKLWDNDGKLLQTFNLGKDVSDQQLGCLALGSELLSITLNGSIHYLDTNNPDQPKRTLLGHNKLVTALTYDSQGDKLYSADFGGYTVETNPSDGATKGFSGEQHKNQVQKLKVSNGKLISISLDDTLKITPLNTREYGAGIPLGSQPSAVDVSGDTIVVSAIGQIVILTDNGQQVTKVPVKYTPSAIAINPDRTEVAVGGKDNKIYLYDLDGLTLKETKVIDAHRGEITALAYSPDGTYLGAGDANREVKIWKKGESVVSGWVFHTSRIQDLAWSQDGDHLATGSVDSAVIVWSVKNPTSRIQIKLAHPGGVRAVVFIKDDIVASTGQDACIKTHKLNY